MPRARSAGLRVLLVCSGLDHVHRGFESFARECFEALRGGSDLEISLVKGSGPAGPGERSIPTLTRDARSARLLARAWGRESFRVEQLAFGASLLPVIAHRRPDVVYLSEWHTALVLARARQASRAGFRIAYCNGAAAIEGFDHLDRVQQLTPIALRMVLDRGADPERQTLLPLGFSITPDFTLVSPEERSGLRSLLGLPSQGQILLSVSALNRQKRIDYVIEELSRVPEPRPYLVALGHPEPDTEAIRALASSRLGPEGHTIRTVPPNQVPAFYRASDMFVLASLGESFGRVLVEAMSHGLPCLAHDYPIARYALGGHGLLGDLSKPGSLSALLQSVGARDPAGAVARHRFVYESFSWDRLRPGYVELLRAAAAAPRHQARGAANSTVSSSSGEEVRTK